MCIISDNEFYPYLPTRYVYTRVRSCVTKVKLFIKIFIRLTTFPCLFYPSPSKNGIKNGILLAEKLLRRFLPNRANEESEFFWHGWIFIRPQLVLYFHIIATNYNECGSAPIEIRSTCLDSLALISDCQYLSSRPFFIINCHSRRAVALHGFRDRYFAFATCVTFAKRTLLIFKHRL